MPKARNRGTTHRRWSPISEQSIVLAVEDDPWIRLLMRDLLTDEGYAVLEASNGSAALRLAERHPPGHDVTSGQTHRPKGEFFAAISR
jgi:CheY-like chemotaxis protein